MMRDDALNKDNYTVRTEMTATKQIPASHVCSTDESELKEFPVDKNLSQICSIYKSELKEFLIDEILLPVCYTG